MIKENVNHENIVNLLLLTFLRTGYENLGVETELTNFPFSIVHGAMSALALKTSRTIFLFK